MRIANTNAKDYVRSRIPFQGNNLFGESIRNGYAVYSYGYHFPLFVYSLIDRSWNGNSDKYSSSTSKHGSQCSIYDYTSKTTGELQELIKTLS